MKVNNGLVTRIKALAMRVRRLARDNDLEFGEPSRYLRRAESIACHFWLTKEQVLEIYLFGGIARRGCATLWGGDVDLIFVVDYATAEQFLDGVYEEAEWLLKHMGVEDACAYTGMSRSRKILALRLLGFEIDDLSVMNHGAVREKIDKLFADCEPEYHWILKQLLRKTNYPVDLFLFPPDWETNERVRNIPVFDPEFIPNLIRDKREFNYLTGKFRISFVKRYFTKYPIHLWQLTKFEAKRIYRKVVPRKVRYYFYQRSNEKRQTKKATA